MSAPRSRRTARRPRTTTTASRSCCTRSGLSSGPSAAGSSPWSSRCCCPDCSGLLNHDNCSTGNNTACTLPLGPGGEAVSDSFYFVHQPLAGNGSITVRVTSLTGRIINSPSNGPVAAGPGGQLGHAPRPRAVVQGRDHHQGEYQPGIALRGDDGHRRARRADAVQLHQGRCPACPARSPRPPPAGCGSPAPETRSPATTPPTASTGLRSAPPPCPGCPRPCRPGCSPPPPRTCR